MLTQFIESDAVGGAVTTRVEVTGSGGMGVVAKGTAATGVQAYSVP